MHRPLARLHLLEPFLESDESFLGGHDGGDFRGLLTSDERMGFVVREIEGTRDFERAGGVAGGADEEVVWE